MKKLFTLIVAMFMAIGMFAQDAPLYSVLGATYYDEEYDADTTIQTRFPEMDSIKIDVYDGYIIIRGVGGVEGYDLMIEGDEEENMVSATPIVKGVEDKCVTKGWCKVETGLTDANWKYFNIWMAEAYNYAAWENEKKSGYVFISCYDAKDLWGYYYLAWGEEDSEESVKTVLKQHLSSRQAYTLTGMPADKNYHGVVIVDGKKTIR